MTLRISSSALTWLSRGMLACSIAILTWCAFVLADRWQFQELEGQALDEQLAVRGQFAQTQESSTAHLSQVTTGTVIGRVLVPRLGISVVVVEGVGNAALRHAAGHIPGTALPGQTGNSAISAHRDTFFRPLRNIRQDDIITLTTPGGDYRYRVVSIRIVSPETVSVLAPSVNQVLTLVTCYPFYFVGAASDRFVVRAERFDGAS